MSNRVYMIYVEEKDFDQIMKKANKILNPEGLNISKALLIRKIIEYVKNKNVKLTNKEIDEILKKPKEKIVVLPRIEPYITILNDLKDYYAKKYKDYFEFTNKKVGYSVSLRLALYEFKKLEVDKNEK